MPSAGSVNDRVLVLMPTLRDAERTGELLLEANVESVLCSDLGHACRELCRGAGALLLTDDVLLHDTAGELALTLRAQPAWSAVPIIVIAREGATEHVQRTASDALTGLVVVERPVRTHSLLSVVLSSLRARRHQYDVRDAIAARDAQSAALAAQEERLRLAMAAGRLGSWSIDVEKKELETSSLCKAAFGRSEDEGFTFEDLRAAIHPEDRERTLEAFDRSLETGGEWDVDCRVIWPNGETRWLLLRGGTVSGNGGPKRLVGVSLDVTERKRLQENLEASRIELASQAEQLRTNDRRKDEFLATLAHELRNPLAPIRTGLDVLSSGNQAPENARALGIMNRQLTHMVRLIDDLLDVSRITRGKLELKKERVTLGAIIDSAVEATRSVVASSGHSLEVDVRDADTAFEADSTRLAQVVGNLLHNAAKYTPRGGRLQLRASAQNGAAEIVVADNGIGIAASRLDDIFDMFSQADPTPRAAQGGLGIGLALVRTLVEMHGGTVRAESPGLGRGSTFTVSFPIESRGASLPAPSLPPPSNAPSARVRVLVVDDNLDAADLLQMMLESDGYATSVAYDSRSALELAATQHPDIAILDIGLPDSNGYEVARALRDSPENRDLLLIALTGWGSAEDKHKAAEAGFDVHLTKPVDGARLRAALSRGRSHHRCPAA